VLRDARERKVLSPFDGLDVPATLLVRADEMIE
jgi:hypothetical protein